jgi:hypothetical protein
MPTPSTINKGGLKSTAAAAEVLLPALPLELPLALVVVLGSGATLDVAMLRDVVVELNPTDPVVRPVDVEGNGSKTLENVTP